jgi:hypothetical protein
MVSPLRRYGASFPTRIISPQRREDAKFSSLRIRGLADVAVLVFLQETKCDTFARGPKFVLHFLFFTTDSTDFGKAKTAEHGLHFCILFATLLFFKVLMIYKSITIIS